MARTNKLGKPSQIPDDMYIGVRQAHWQLQFFYGSDAEGQALEWMGSDTTAGKRLYRVKVEPVERLGYVRPVAGRLQVEEWLTEPPQLAEDDAAVSLPRRGGVW
jgi:hypothetical protein